MVNSKNIVFIAQSLDGYIAGPNGEIDWLDMVPNEEQNDMGYLALMNEVEAIVMGRKTFETVLGFGIEWPYTKPVFVLSHSMTSVPNDLSEKVFLLSGSPSEVTKTLNGKGYHNLYIDGGRTIQNFLSEDAIDELRITTIPILLGGGHSLFGALGEQILFEHVHTEVFLGELVQSHFKRKE